MNSPEIKVSQALARKAQSLGAEGLEWLAKLPQLVTELARDWQLVVGDPFTGGSEGYVTEAKTLDGMDVVLKVAMPPMEGNAVIAEEIWALKIANGQGYARLYRYDLSRRALLLERLGPYPRVPGVLSLRADGDYLPGPSSLVGYRAPKGTPEDRSRSCPGIGGVYPGAVARA